MDKRKQFCVVQFMDLPFKSKDDYVCVPYSWVILRRLTDLSKATVAYPVDEDPFTTRARARRNERYDDNWEGYRATIKYESDSYSDAEYWITTRNDYVPIKEKEEVSDSKDPDPEPVLDRKLRSTTQYPSSSLSSDKNKMVVKPYGNSQKPMIKMSIKRPIQSEPKNLLSEKQPKIVKTAESNRVTTNTGIRPGSSKRKQSITNDPLISAETKESAATSNSEKSTEKTIESHHAREDQPLVQPGPSNTLQSTSSTQQDPKVPKIRVGVTNKTKNDSHQPELRGVIRRITPIPVLPKVSNIMRESFFNTQRNYPIQDPRIQARLNVRFTEQNNNAQAANPQNIMIEPLAVRQNFEVQPTSSSKRSHETQYKQVHDNQVYQNPRMFKMVVNQSTEMNATTKHVHFEDKIVRSPPIESSSVVMNGMCQTDENFSGESLSPDGALVSDHKVVITHEVVSDYKMSTEETPVEIKNYAGSPKERIPPESDSSVRSIADQPTTSSNQVHPRIIIEQKMLYEFAHLFIQMGTTMSQTSDMFKSLQSSILDSAEIYLRVIEAVHVFNKLGNFSNTATPSVVVSETSHITEKRQTGEENPNNDDNNTNNSVDETPKLNQGHRRTFVLPPEYDPNDSKWTLKYRRSMPELVELMPQSDIYVSYSHLEYFKQTSQDCKTLACMLLTEVFSMSALSVCSLTVSKAKASDDVDNVRPGLDEWARIVLLKFVEKFGLQRGWNSTDTLGIANSMRDKIDEIRAKYSQRSRF